MTVTALLVSHDGARWLPAVLDGLESQTRLPNGVVAVDTGSSDASVSLLTSRLGADAVLDAPVESTFGQAVRAGLDATSSDGHEWVWLLHDDSRPAPDALEKLMAAAHANPSAAILGPKHREWPSLRRLLEVGVTISGTGRRETGLERGEYDQGQHDQQRDVLAVNTAGMLVRRDVLEQIGFDDRLPIFGNDVDFGWRAARAGHRAVVVPEAVVFHVEAAHRGVRRTSVTGGHRRAERRAALYTLLVNCSLAALPFQVVRLFLGSLVRALGLLLVRAPRESYDELAALVLTYLRPDRIVAGRKDRRRTATVPPSAVRHLLAAPWVPYRHGLDFLTDIAAAVASQAGEANTARRSRRVEALETGPVPTEAQNLPADSGLISRLLTSPTAWVFTLLTLLSLVGARGLMGGGTLSGGSLLPAPDSALAWWQLHLSSWHPTGVGSVAPAGPYLLPLALGGTLLLAKAWLLVDILFLLVIPLSAYGGYRFLMLVTGSRTPSLWGGVAYGLVPMLSGAVSQGRLGTVAAAIVLPWLAHAALFLAPQFPPDRRWRAAWRTGLLLGLLTAFASVAWLIAVVLAAIAVVGGLVSHKFAARSRMGWGPIVASVAIVPLLLVPWSALTAAEGRGAFSWLAEAGLPAPELLGQLTAWDVLVGRPADLGAAPGWISLGIAVAALAALLRADTRQRVVHAWVVLVVTLAVTAVLSGLRVETPGSTELEPLWLGFPLLLLQACGITAAALASPGILARLSGSSFGWRQPVGLVVVAGAFLAPVAGAVWVAAVGVEGPLDRRPVRAVPAYMAEAAGSDVDTGTLVIRSAGDRLEYDVYRGDGSRLGDDSVVPAMEEYAPLTELVGNLATAPRQQDVERLSDFGVEFIYTPPPTDAELVGNLDTVSGLTSASVVRPGARAWQLETEPATGALAEPRGWAHPWLLALQLVALVTVAILAAPSRKVAR